MNSFCGTTITPPDYASAAAFAEAERDRERIGQLKAHQKARGRYLCGKVPWCDRLSEDGEQIVPHPAEQEAIREMIALRAQGKPLRAIAAATAAKATRSPIWASATF